MSESVPPNEPVLLASEALAKKCAGEALDSAVQAQVECLRVAGGQVDAGNLVVRLMVQEIHLNALQDLMLLPAPEGETRSLAERFFADIEKKSHQFEGQMRRALLASGATVRDIIRKPS
jgi:hypothetical protein